MFWQGLVLGLSNGALCLATCAPALVPTLLLEERFGRRFPWGPLGQFLAGRLLAYLLVGWLAGYVGMRWGQELPPGLMALAWAVLGGLLVVRILVGKRLGPDLRPPPALAAFPLLYGLLLGLAPCLPFGLALTTALERSRPLDGLLLFAAFYLTTSLFLLPLGFLGRLARRPTVRQVARWTAVLVGVGFVLLGLDRLV